MDSAQKIDQQSKEAIAKNLQAAGHNISPDQISPNTAETPVPESEDMKAAQAHRIGDEPMPISLEDVGYAKDTVEHAVTGKSIWYRLGRGFKGLGILKSKLHKKIQATKKEPVEI